MPPRRRKRIDPNVFGLPVDLIKQGFYADAFAARSRDVVRQNARAAKVLMQFTGKHEGWLGGIDEAVAMLKLCVDDWNALVVNALYEGDRYEHWDTVLTVEGPYDAFGHLATTCLGTLSRRTRVCTNAKLISTAAGSKPVLLLGVASDAYWSQAGDGFSAMAGGVKMFSTDAQASLFNGKAVGSVSHTTIAALGGDTVKAAKRFCDANDGVDVLALVDYDNDCAKTSVDVARALEGRLWGVRLDTPDTMVDKSIVSQMGSFPPAGVNAALVWNVRNALDAEGFGEVKIVASGGIDVPRIVAFEEDGVPVDVYGVGAALFNGSFDFAADVVEVNGKPESRAGRKSRENSRMERVK
jgi:nicotinate phosphoribosyltransferase